MSTILKQLREDQGKDLKEISAVTRIKESFLRYIENEQYEKLPIDVYARGYIKVYAKYLGLSSEQALDPYLKYLELKDGPKEDTPAAALIDLTEVVPTEAVKPAEEIVLPHPAVLPPCSPAENSSSAIRLTDTFSISKPLFIAALAGIFIVLSFFMYYLGTSRGAGKEAKPASIKVAAATPQVEQPKEEAPAPQVPAVTPAAPAAKAVAVPQPFATPASNTVLPAVKAKPDDPLQANRRRHVMVLSATERTWVQLTIDGKDKREMTLEPGETQTIEAFRSITGTVGNSGGVKIKFNGKQLTQGKKGEVMNLNLPEKKPLENQPLQGMQQR